MGNKNYTVSRQLLVNPLPEGSNKAPSFVLEGQKIIPLRMYVVARASLLARVRTFPTPPTHTPTGGKGGGGKGGGPSAPNRGLTCIWTEGDDCRASNIRVFLVLAQVFPEGKCVYVYAINFQSDLLSDAVRYGRSWVAIIIRKLLLLRN